MAELRKSRRVRGLPPDFIPISGENPMEAIDQGDATNSQVGESVVAKSRGPYTSHSPPLVQQPSRENTLFHSPMKVMLMILPVRIMVPMLHFGIPL